MPETREKPESGAGPNPLAYAGTTRVGTPRADAPRMDAVHLQRRIFVVLVTTRAAASSLAPGDGQVQSAVRRGIQLLDGMTEEVAREGDAETNEQLAQARRELESLLGDGST